jgi:D,D-heptose 1,7-bisphosphate phosphatase
MRSAVAILAGGKGTRLISRSAGLPKPMVQIAGIPILEHQINLCRRHGLTKILLLVEHQHNLIRSYFGDGLKFGVSLSYSVEASPRGTAGALYDALAKLDEDFFVLYGDTYADVNLRKLFDFHKSKNADATIFLHPNDHPSDSDLVDVDVDFRVNALRAYPHPKGVAYGNLVNAGLYVMRRSALAQSNTAKYKSDLAKHTFPELLEKNMFIQGYVSVEYIKDMGTPERLEKVESDIQSGRPERLSDRYPRRAVFLDRDGTINSNVGHLKDVDQLELIPGVAQGIKALNHAGIITVCVTNQPVIARGELSVDGLKEIHGRLDHLLGASNAYIDRYYFCPHHPDRGFNGERGDLKMICNCRKPSVGMFERAELELNIDRANSWLIGDATTDILAGRTFGVRTILVRTGFGGLDRKVEIEPDYIFNDLTQAVDWILRGRAKIVDQLTSIIESILEARVVYVGGLARSGKSTTARVLQEVLSEHRRVAHIVGLDGWLKPASERLEGIGVENRYDLTSLKNALIPLLNGSGKTTLIVPKYDRIRKAIDNSLAIEVDSTDIIILEGVPALFNLSLPSCPNVKIFVDTAEEERNFRLQADYKWRGMSEADMSTILNSRLTDEVPWVKEAALSAQFRIYT